MDMSKFRNILLFILISVSYSQETLSQPQIPSVKEFLSDDSGSYDSYIYGIESGFAWASELYYRKHKIEFYCIPNNIDLPASKLRQVIIDSINNKPGFFKKYENEPLIGLALRNGLINQFPCQ
jgi:hypothetical protein